MKRMTSFGFAAWFAVACGTPETVEVVREPTSAEVEAACTAEDAAKDELSAAQWRVGELEREVAVSEGKVKDLEGRISSGGGGQLQQELERYRALVTKSKDELAIALAEMHAVAARALGQRHAVIHQHRHAARLRDRQDGRRGAQDRVREREERRRGGLAGPVLRVRRLVGHAFAGR